MHKVQWKAVKKHIWSCIGAVFNFKSIYKNMFLIIFSLRYAETHNNHQTISFPAFSAFQFFKFLHGQGPAKSFIFSIWANKK